MQEEVEFKCAGCGNCCMSYGYVYLTTEDRVLLSTHLNVSVVDFTKQYCEKKNGDYHLKDPDNDCGFLVDKKCSVYEARPGQCRTWPFWPTNFTNGKFNYSGNEYCKGLKRSES
jgi:Fe-S-cluster containining protein